MKRKIALFVMIMLLFAVSFAQAEMTGKQIVEKIRDRVTAKTQIMQVKMTIADKRGDERVRTIFNRMKEYPEGGKSVISFVKPDDVKGTKFLIKENKTGDDDQFLYMPALKKVRRISSSQKSGSFMGSDFSYADMQSQDPEDGEHTNLGQETLDGVTVYKVQSIPKDGSDAEYSKVIYWVRADDFIPVKGEFYDKRGDLLKVLTVTKIEKDATGRMIPKDTLMKNVQKGSSTRLEVLQQKSDAPIADDFFTERFLTDETKL